MRYIQTPGLTPSVFAPTVRRSLQWIILSRVHRKRLAVCDSLQFSSIFTARCTIVQSAGLAIACRPSVCLSVCNVGGLWSHRLEILETNCTDS